MTEIKFSELDLSFSKTGAGHALGMRFLKAGEDAPREIPAIEISINPVELDEFDAESYGKTLASQVFGADRLKSALGEWMTLAAGTPLRIQIKISPDAADLHSLAWEKLRDPQTGAPLTTSENTWFSRYPASQDRRPVVLRPKGALKALAVAANPSDLATLKLAAVDADAEIARAREALGEIPSKTLGDTGAPRATLENMLGTLRDGADVLLLACHGVMTGSGPILFLEAEDGKMARTKAEDFVTRLAELEARQLPRLIVLASCESAGKENAGSMAAFGPRLAEIGVPAVLAMQGKISMDTVKTFMPVFFKELNRDGQIDRALAVARSSVRKQHDAWMPVLFLRSVSGLLWDETRQERFSADQVQALIGTIKANFQPKEFKGDCPYVGLAPFEEENADLFFGRERLVDELLERVQQSRGVFIAGPSGSGKSSLIRAGFIPALKKGKESKLWKYATMKPGRNPLLELKRALERVSQSPGEMPGSGQSPANWQDAARQLFPADQGKQFVEKAESALKQVPAAEARQALASLFAELGSLALHASAKPARTVDFEQDVLKNPSALHEVAETLLGDRRGQRLVLLIDQFEELFTQVDSEQIRQAFVDTLEDAVLREDGRVVLILTMRSDFVPNFAAYPKLNTLLNKFFFQVGMMTPEELVRSIVLPAQTVNLEIEPGLVSQIITDIGDEPGALPLMQFALKDLFEAQKATGDMTGLTLKDYLQRGGIHKALERHADGVFATLDNKQKELARSIFIGLVDVGGETQLTKRTATSSELTPPGVEAAEVEKIIHNLADARLVTTGSSDGKTTVTIAHEKLITAWGWLKKLVDENREAIAAQNEIASDAREWEAHDRDASFLYRGARLATVREKLEAGRLALGGLALEFVEAGKKLYTDELQAEKQRADHLQKVTNNAIARQLATQAQSILATQDVTRKITAALLAAQSLKLSPTSEAARILFSNDIFVRPLARMMHAAAVRAVAFSPDGQRIVSGGADKTMAVWKTANAEKIFSTTQNETIHAVAFSPDSRLLATGSDADSIGGDWWNAPDRERIDRGFGTVRLWNAETGLETRQLAYKNIFAVAFPPSPETEFIASAGQDYTICIWNAGDGSFISQMDHNGPVRAFAYSPDGKYIVSGSDDKTVRVWNAATGAEITRAYHNEAVLCVAFSPDGRYVASGSADQTARLWSFSDIVDMASLSETDHVKHNGPVTAVAFHPEISFDPSGFYLASASADKTVRLWLFPNFEMEGHTIRGVSLLLVHDAGVNAVAFSPDGQYVVTGCDDGSVQLWPSRADNSRLSHETIGLWGTTIRLPNTDEVACASFDNAFLTWPCEADELRKARSDYGNIWLSPDGKLMFKKEGSRIRLWKAGENEEDGVELRYEYYLTSLRFTADSRMVITTGCDNEMQNYDSLECTQSSVKVWDASTGSLLAQREYGKLISVAAISPDRKLVVFGGADNITRIWQLETDTEIAQIEHNSAVTSVAISADGRLAASASADWHIIVWDVATAKEVARLIHDDTVNAVAFSPDGKYLASGSSDLTTRVWEIATRQEVARMSFVQSVNSIAFSPDGRFVLTGTVGSNLRLWLWQPADLLASANKNFPRTLTEAEWQQYIGDLLPFEPQPIVEP